MITAFDFSVGVSNRAPGIFLGLSTDKKPVDVRVNSLLFELDTKKKFYFHEYGKWAEVGALPEEAL